MLKKIKYFFNILSRPFIIMLSFSLLLVVITKSFKRNDLLQKAR